MLLCSSIDCNQLKPFVLGAALATSACAIVWIIRCRSERKYFAEIELEKRIKRFDSFTHALDVAQSMSDKSPDRAMLAFVAGEDLLFQYIDPKLLNFLGYGKSDERPTSVYDILPQTLAKRHRQWASDAIRAGKLPERLDHPLRYVDVRHHSGFHVKMDLKLEWALDCNLKEPCFQLIFVPCKSSEVPALSVGEQITHDDAFVVLLDIVEFTKACGRMSAVEVLEWMKRVRSAVEDMLSLHNMQLIETRGDNYLAITTGKDNPMPASRAVCFAALTAEAVAALQDTRIRVGIARGPVTVAQLQCMGSRQVLCIFGDVVNVAGRLEQSADPARIHMSEPVATEYARENDLFPPPPIRVAPAKGKPEGIRSAQLDWRAGAFVEDSVIAVPPPILTLQGPVVGAAVDSSFVQDSDDAAAAPPILPTQRRGDSASGGDGGGCGVIVVRWKPVCWARRGANTAGAGVRSACAGRSASLQWCSNYGGGDAGQLQNFEIIGKIEEKKEGA